MTTDSNGLGEIVRDLEAYVLQEKGNGVKKARVSVQAVEELGRAPTGGASATLNELADSVRTCTKCQLHETRTNAVPGQGSGKPEIMFIGEAPGADEDAQGLAFVGRAGKLLTKMIDAMGLTRDEVFIGNILKCRPPKNRPPLPEEISVCIPYLKQQIALLKPDVIVTLGGTSAKALLETDTGITKLRGIWTEWEGVQLMPTYHPAYLLRNPSAKHETWSDLQAVLEKVGKSIPEQKKN